MKIIELEDRRYLLSAIDVTKNTQLTFVPTYKLGNEAALVYEFVIKPIEGDLDQHEISAGVAIRWKKDVER